MVKLDSFKMGIPVEVFEWIDLEGKTKETKSKQKNGRLVSEKIEVKNLGHGFNLLSFDTLSNKVTLSGSAKILGNDYRQGISINTIDQVTEKLNEPKAFKIDPDKLLEYAEMYTFDPCITIDVSNLSECARSVLTYCSANSMYEVSDYYPSGYVAKRKVKGYKERQVGYAKLKEITGTKNTFIKDYPKAVKTFNKDSLRIENNITSHATMRKWLGIESNTLVHVLNSQNNPVYDSFQRIVKPGKQIPLFHDQFRGMSLPEIRNKYGWDSIFREFGYDLEKVLTWIRYNWAHNKRDYYYKLAKKEYGKRRTKDIKSINSYIEEISELLKAS